MNAVEAVEQLGALGRKLQAREVGLQQPSLRLQAALRQGAAWEKVLGDPLTVLSQVLGAAGGGRCASRMARVHRRHRSHRCRLPHSGGKRIVRRRGVGSRPRTAGPTGGRAAPRRRQVG